MAAEAGASAPTRGAGPAKAIKPSGSMYLAILVAMVGAMMFGLDQGNFGNVQSFATFLEAWCVGRYGDKVTCSKENAEKNREWTDGFVLWGATLITFGAAAGALALGPSMASNYGRRPCIACGGGVCFVGCLMASYLSFDSVPVFYLGRFVTGFGVGVSCYALPMYNAEVSTAAIRGATGSLFQLNVVIGGFTACLITLFCRDWKVGMILPGLAGAVLMVASCFIPESPRFVMEKKGYEAGLKELKRVRSGNATAEATEIYTQIKDEEEIEQVGYLELFREPNLRRRVVIACTLVLGQQATGVNAFLGYAATLFRACGIDSPIAFNTLFNSIMIFGCTAGLFLVDSKYGGRRCQLFSATVIMGPPLILAGLCLQFDWSGWITMTALIVYGVGFQFAWGTIPWIYPAEIFSMAEKEKAMSLAVCLNYVANAVVVFITPFVMSASVPGTLYFFGFLNILNALFVWVYIQETKGVPLEQIPALFDGGARESSSESDSESEEDECSMSSSK